MNLLLKITKIIAKIILVVLVCYIGYSLYNVYNSSDSIAMFFKRIFNYSIIDSGDVKFTIGKIGMEIGLLIGSYYLADLLTNNFIVKILDRTNLDHGGKASVLKLSNYILVFIFVVISLSLAQIPLTAFTFIGGALAIGAGFGSQNMINNFISGIIIQIEKPIKVGDTVQIENSIGKIDEIGVRSTKVLLPNNTHLIIPNSFFLEKNITNWHLKNGLVKTRIIFELSLAQSFDELKTRIETLVVNKPEARDTLIILITEIKPSGYVVEVAFDLSIDAENKNEIESEIRAQIISLHHQAKIKLTVAAPK